MTEQANPENAPKISSVYINALLKMASLAPELVLDLKDFIIDEEIIGKGGEGIVYKGKWKNDKKYYAIKQPLPERLDDRQFRRFISEIQAMLECRFPYTLRVLGFTIKHPYSVVTEYLPKTSLSKYLGKPGKSNKNKPLTDTEKVIIALGVACGLQQIHERNIIHRDVKCGNILLDDKMYPHLCDFGIAIFRNSRKTVKVGTPVYMAPEMIAGDTSYSSAVDMYSFAIVLYELSEPVRPRKIPREELYQCVCVQRERPPLTSATTPAMRDLITNLWDHDPSKRFTAAAAATYIKEHADSLFPRVKHPDKVTEYLNWAKKRSNDKPIVFSDMDFLREEEEVRPEPVLITGADILRDPSHPKFVPCVMQMVHTMTPEEFTRNIGVFEEAFSTQNLFLQTMYVMVFVHFVNRRADFIPILRDFLPKMRMTCSNAGDIAQLLFEIVRKGSIDDIDWTVLLQQMSTVSFERCLALIEMLLDLDANDVTLRIANAIAGDLASALPHSPHTWKFIDQCQRVCSISPNETLTSELVASISKIFSISDNNETIASCLDFFIKYPLEIPTSKLATVISTHCEAACELLLMEPRLFTPAILDALLLRFSDPIVPPVLAAFSDTPSGAKFMTDNPQWMEKFEDNLSSVLVILLTVIRHNTGISSNPSFLGILISCAKQRTPETIKSACILASAVANRTTGTRLARSGFWRELLASVKAFPDNQKLHIALMNLVHDFAKVAYISEFAVFLEYVLERVYKYDIPALRAFSVLSSAPEIANPMKNYIRYFTSMAKKENCREYATIVCNNLTSCK